MKKEVLILVILLLLIIPFTYGQDEVPPDEARFEQEVRRIATETGTTNVPTVVTVTNAGPYQSLTVSGGVSNDGESLYAQNVVAATTEDGTVFGDATDVRLNNDGSYSASSVGTLRQGSLPSAV